MVWQAVRGDRDSAVNPHLIRDWATAGAEGLEALRGEINDLNVFPIPDSDTGSNMAYTMRQAADAVATLPDDADLKAVTRRLSETAVAKARGNSGVILAQILTALFDAVDLQAAENDRSFNRLCVTGLRLGARAAKRAVSGPREGTVLTLVRVAADVAAENVDGTPADLVRAIADACADALEQTPAQMPELASAGVVDAGARGFLALMDAMVLVVTGVENRRRPYRGILIGGGDPMGHAADACDSGSGMAFEVMYLLEGVAGEQITGLRAALDEIGDSLVIVGDSSTEIERFSVHVHTDEPGRAVEAGVVLGRLSDIRISCFQLDAMRAGGGELEAPPTHRRAVVAVVRGDGAAELFTDAGAAVVRAEEGIDSGRLVRAIRETDSAHVVVMANGVLPSPELVTVAAEARSAVRSVVFVPTSAMVQCLAALAVHDASAGPDSDAFEMAEAAANTRWGSLVRSNSRMVTLAGTCEVGDILGCIGPNVLVISDDQVATVTALVDLMLATGGELVTVLTGADHDPAVSDAIAEHLRVVHPGVEVAFYHTGQDDELLQIGVE